MPTAILLIWDVTMASKMAIAIGTDAPRSILLRCGAMPNYSIVNESEEEMSSLKERVERLHHEQRLQDDAHLSELAVLLHSLFSKFCYPPPSMASVLDILLLERQRILSLNINIDNSWEHQYKSRNEHFCRLYIILWFVSVWHVGAESVHLVAHDTFSLSLERHPVREKIQFWKIEWQLALYW